jgi:hypothetical protein
MYLQLGAVLNTRLALMQALTTVVERVEVTHNHFAHKHPDQPLISDAELAHVRTLALALMCRYCDDARTGLGARLERLVFPEDTRTTALPDAAPRRADTTVLPVLTHAVPDEAETVPADFDDTLQLDTLHLATHPAWRG